MRDRIVIAIDRNGPMTRTELVRYTGFPRSTLYDALVILVADHRVVTESRNIGRGRPKIVWKLV